MKKNLYVQTLIIYAWKNRNKIDLFHWNSKNSIHWFYWWYLTLYIDCSSTDRMRTSFIYMWKLDTLNQVRLNLIPGAQQLMKQLINAQMTLNFAIAIIFLRAVMLT